MTSQKFFNNKYGMVLASDSLSTVAFNKTYPGACKIFELKKNPACGLMISGSSEFGGIPFEILVSKFKKSTDLSKIDTVGEIKDNFLDYLAKNTPKVNLNDYIDENISQFKINLEKNIEKMSEKEFWIIWIILKNLQYLNF